MAAVSRCRGHRPGGARLPGRWAGGRGAARPRVARRPASRRGVEHNAGRCARHRGGRRRRGPRGADGPIHGDRPPRRAGARAARHPGAHAAGAATAAGHRSGRRAAGCHERRAGSGVAVVARWSVGAADRCSGRAAGIDHHRACARRRGCAVHGAGARAGARGGSCSDADRRLAGRVEPRAEALDRLVRAGQLGCWEWADGEVRLYGERLAAGAGWDVPISCVAIATGTSQGRPSSVYAYVSPGAEGVGGRGCGWRSIRDMGHGVGAGNATRTGTRPWSRG